MILLSNPSPRGKSKTTSAAEIRRLFGTTVCSFRTIVTLCSAIALAVSLAGCSGSSRTTKAPTEPDKIRRADRIDDRAADSSADDSASGPNSGDRTNPVSDDEAAAAKEPPEVEQATAEDDGGDEDGRAGGDEQVAGATSGRDADGSASESSEAMEEGSVGDDRGARERFVLFSPLCPLVVDLEIEVDGAPLRQAFEQLVDHSLDLADSDGDGEPTWEEISKSRHFIYGQLGNVEITSEQQRREMIRMYDTDGNGRVDRDEVPRFLTRNAGGSRAFSLRSSNLHRDDNVRGSRIRRLLDEDDDGALTTDELLQANRLLRTRDVDDDEIVVPADLADEATDRFTGLPGTSIRGRPDVAAQLGPTANWEAIATDLREHYAFGGPLTKDCFGPLTDLFDALDENSDGEVDGKELRRLDHVDAQIVIRARFGRPTKPSADSAPSEDSETDQTAEENETEEEDAVAEREDEVHEEAASEPAVAQPVRRLEVVRLHKALGDFERDVTVAAERLTLRLAGANLEFFVNDQAMAGQEEAAAETPFAMLDQDKNGYLDKEEVGEDGRPLGFPFEALDADEDGKAYLEEVRQFARQRQSAFKYQVRSRVADHPDALFTALDTNSDGRLTARELVRAGDRLAALDDNGDGRIAFSETPGSMVVGIVRGNPQQGDALFNLPTTSVASAESTEVAAWFRSMDANSDGDISPREFLGTAEQFGRLDRDGDGFLRFDETNTRSAAGR